MVNYPSRLRYWLPLVLLTLASLAAQAQAHFNLGLEPRANHGYPLVLWAQHRAPGGRAQLDSSVFRQGRGSLRLELAEEEERVFMALYSSVFPLDSLRGQLATVSGWVRTRGFRGRAGIYAYAHSQTTEGYATDRVNAVDSLPADMDWRRLELRLPVKAIADGFGVGMQAYGSGRVWFDDLQVRVGGRLLGTAPLAGTSSLLLTAAEALTPNWDFERPLPRLAAPSLARATVALDSAQPQHGRRYLRLASPGAVASPAPVFYLGTLKIAPELFGKSLQVKGYWRQTAPGQPLSAASSFTYTLLHTDKGSTYRTDSPTGWGSSALQNAPALPSPGPQWTEFSLTIPIPNDDQRLEALALSLRLPSGTVELDNFQFALNGTPYVPTGPPTPPAPTAAESAWLRTTLKPLNLAAAPTDFQDLAPLGSLVGAAHLVGLGEVVPGSHEIALAKQRLVRYLVSQKGFTGLLLDCSPTGGAALNDYLQTGQGDPSRLLAALGTTWQTTEMLGLVRWLRAHNQASPGAKVFVAGLELQPELALTQFQQTLKSTDDFTLTRLRQLAPLLAATIHPNGTDLDLRHHPDQATDSLLPAVRRLLAELAAGLDTRAKLSLGNSPSLRELARQRHYLRLVEQGATLRRLPLEYTTNYRAACLAEHVQYLSQQAGSGGGPAKLLLWGSNTLVASSAGPGERPLGQWLRATYGAGYVALAVAVGQGSYATRAASSRLAPTPLAPAPAGSYEAWLRTGPPAFLLNLTKLELTDVSAWLFQQQLLREASWRATPYQFGLHSLRSEFDAVVFLRDSTPAISLP
jgi:erythromycin esterase-like protein